MRWKLWNAALLAALILTFGMFPHPRATQAGGNDDVEFVQPPGSENGDPDSGGPGRFSITRFTSWIAAQARQLALCRNNSASRPSVNRVPAGTSSRQMARVRK